MRRNLAGLARPFSLGWHPVDPGPGPLSGLLDIPPAASDPAYAAAHSRWRAAVEADSQHLQATRLQGDLWHPLALPSEVRCLPVYGGTPRDLEQVATMLAVSCIESGLGACRVVDLTGWDLSGTAKSLMSRATRNSAGFDTVGPSQTSVNLFGNPKVSELVSLLTDVFRVSSDRTGTRHTQQDRQELEALARLLDPPVTLSRLVHAVDLALGSSATPQELSADEARRLRAHHASVVAQRRTSQDRLANLHLDLDSLRAFDKVAGRSQSLGSGKLALRWYTVASGSSTGHSELGTELISRALLQQFNSVPNPELLVVIGAENLADDVRAELAHAAQRLQKCVAFLFTRLDGPGRDWLGHAGSTLTMILRLPNPIDATAAAEFLGREYKFVVNGVSIAEGRTQEWNSTYGTQTGHSVGHGSSSTSGGGFMGSALGFSHSVGSSVTSTYSTGTSKSTTSGGSISSTTTRSQGRVHEFVLEPEVFQQMPDSMMFIVHSGTVTVASCDNGLRRGRSTSSNVLELP